MRGGEYAIPILYPDIAVFSSQVLFQTWCLLSSQPLKVPLVSTAGFRSVVRIHQHRIFDVSADMRTNVYPVHSGHIIITTFLPLLW